MEIKESRRGEVVVLQPIGSIDTRAAFEFEQKVVGLLGGGVRRFVIDFGQVEQLTSAGIRVLLMLAKKLAGTEGGLIVCSLTDHVRTVLEISGLAGEFPTVDSAMEAVGRLLPGRRSSEVAVLALSLLSRRAASPRVRCAVQETPSRLAVEVAASLRGDAG